MLAMVTRAIANHNLFETASLKITNAIMDVATISKLFSKDTFAEFVMVIPNITKPELLYQV